MYLDEDKPHEGEILEGLDSALREFIAHLVSAKHESDFLNNVYSEDFFDAVPPSACHEQKQFSLAEMFETPLQTGEHHVSGEMDNGGTPLISTSSANNGVEKFVDVLLESTHKNAITIASDGMPLTSFFHYYPFVAKDNVIICHPNRKYRFATLLYITAQLNRLRWRFSYGRKCYLNKADKIKIFLPVNAEGSIDEDYIEFLSKQLPSWGLLKKLFGGASIGI